jgi:hypothetical protein
MPRDGDQARLARMFELAMTRPLSIEIPAISLAQCRPFAGFSQTE